MDLNNQINFSNSSNLEVATFYLNETLCGIDIAFVQEINDNQNMTKVPLTPNFILGIINLRGQIVTVIDQNRKIGFLPSNIGANSKIVIVKSKNEFIGLLVDKISEVISIHTKEIKTPPRNIKGAQGKYFKGVYYTQNNGLLSIIDVNAVLAAE